MEKYCLASSSAGNCFILNMGTRTLLMVECGLPYKEIIKKCNEQGIDFTQIESCLITHSHKDHCVSASDLIARGINVYGSSETMLKLAVNGEIMQINTPQKVADGIFALAFGVKHDAEGSVGYVIKSKSETVIFINDHSSFAYDLSAITPDYVFIECNHDNDKVISKIHDLNKKLETADEVEREEIKAKLLYYNRNADYHSSLKGTIKNLERLNLTNCKEIILIHLSDENSDQAKMVKEVNKATGIKTTVALKNGGIL